MCGLLNDYYNVNNTCFTVNLMLAADGVSRNLEKEKFMPCNSQSQSTFIHSQSLQRKHNNLHKLDRRIKEQIDKQTSKQL